MPDPVIAQPTLLENAQYPRAPVTDLPYVGRSSLARAFPGTLGNVTGMLNNPLLGTALSSLLLGGAGYGVGKIIDKFRGKDSRLGRSLGITGALTGAAVGAPWLLHNKWKGIPLTSPIGTEPPANLNNVVPAAMERGAAPLAAGAAMRSFNPGMMNPGEKTGGLKAPPGFFDAMVKCAGLFSQGSGFSVPVSSTASSIYADPLLSPIEKAKLLSVLERADESGTGLVTPRRLAQAAVGAGLGYVGGTLTAKVLSAFFGGLPPSSQRVLQGAGVFAGIVNNVI